MAKKKLKPLEIQVYLIGTSELKRTDIEEVKDVLCLVEVGPLKFICIDTPINIQSANKILSKKEYLTACKRYREESNIDPNAFLILLTSMRNRENYFSHFTADRNIFIQTSDWKRFTKAEPKYPIAYSAVENILQVYMDLKDNEAHIPAIGCMNDQCDNKRDILLKLRTADICEDCLSKLASKKVDVRIVNQVLQIMEGLRAQFLFNKEYNRSIVPCSIEVTKYGKFVIPQIGNLTLELDPIFKTLYLLFLQNPKGITSSRLRDYEEKLLEIYRKLSKNLEDEYLLKKHGRKTKNEKTVKKLVASKQSTFKTNKSKLNSEILEQLGELLLKYYGISRSKEDGFKTSLEPKNIKIDLDF